MLKWLKGKVRTPMIEAQPQLNVGHSREEILGGKIDWKAMNPPSPPKPKC